jgi:WhiB family redox-sensing transcriptional regulator
MLRPPTPDWMAEGVCRSVDPEIWFPPRGDSNRTAKQICRKCSVRPECLEYALVHDERFGVWGGMSEGDRRKLKRRTGS